MCLREACVFSAAACVASVCCMCVCVSAHTLQIQILRALQNCCQNQFRVAVCADKTPSVVCLVFVFDVILISSVD